MEWDEDGIGRDKDRWAPWYCIIFGVSVPANLESVARLALANKARNPGRYARRAPHRFSGGIPSDQRLPYVMLSYHSTPKPLL
jgi:hypothetical protein